MSGESEFGLARIREAMAAFDLTVSCCAARGAERPAQ
jgi:hypothetical protein